MTIVVDASVAVRWTIETDLSKQAEKLLRSGEALIAPDFIIVEATNVLLFNVRDRTDRIQRALDGLEFLPRWFNELVPAATLRHRAMAYALELKHSAYDCFYLALAASRGVRFVTTDEKFIRAAALGDEGHRVVHLADWTS